MDGLFHALALDADEFGVFAAVGTEGDETESPSSEGEQQTQAPGPGHTSDLLSGNTLSVLSADAAGRSARVVVGQVDDHGALLASRRGVVGGGRRGRGLRIAVGSRGAVGGRCSVGGRLCVHLFEMIIIFLVIY